MYWFEDPSNPFKQMSWTRGGGGYDNPATHESNERRAEAMPGVDGLPRFAAPGIGASLTERGDRFVVDEMVYQNGPKTTGPGQDGHGTSSQGGGNGAGSVGAVQGDPRKGGGSGPGSRLVLGGAQGVWWDKAGELSVPAKSWVSTAALPPLQPVMKGTNTAIMIGGVPFVPNPGTSDAEEIEALLGDGDNLTEIAWWFKQAAGLSHISYNHQHFVETYPEAHGGDGWADIVDGFAMQDARLSQGLHRAFGTGYVVPMGGF